MAMLAERKRKQKWCLNPRGKDWAEDSNKFGQKLLEKMGWSKGKGLGANEDGITEHVKVSFKHDNKGMGFKEDQDPWTENEVGFSNLLKDLSAQQGEEYHPHLGSDGTSDNSECNETLKIQSLEKKSQASRARVHYRKFTRGKDLSRYSSKDLANIFGKSSLKVVTSTRKGNKSDEDQVSSTTNYGEIDGETSGNLVTSGSSMNEYFENKLKIKRLNVPSTVTSSDVIDDSQSSDTDTPMMVLPASTSTDVVTTTTSSNMEETDNTKKKKKKKSNTLAIDDVSESYPDSSQDQIEESNYYVETKKDRKKRKMLKDEDLLKIKLKKKHTYDNPALNLNDSSSSSINAIENNFGEVSRSHHHKKKKIKGIENPGLELSDPEGSPPKKKKRKTTFVSYINTENSTDTTPHVNTLTVKSVPKKRKRSQTLDEDKPPVYDNPAFQHHNTDSDDTDDVANVIDKILPELDEKPRKLKGICNHGLDDSLTTPKQQRKQRRKQKEVLNFDIVYNSEPNTPKSALKKTTEMIKPRKSVQINESINQEKFITDESENSHEGGGLIGDEDDEENSSISKRIDDYQIELENSLNEKKCVTVVDNTSKKFKNIVLKRLSKRRASIEFPGVTHESIIKGYGNKD